MRYFAALLVTALSIPSFSQAADSEGQEDKIFVGLRATHLELRSINGDRTAKMPGAELMLGSFITDYVRVEGRLGASIGKESPEPGLEVNIKGYASWYMGAQYPITDYANIYGLYGVSFVKGEASRDEPRTFQKIPDKLVSSSFSVSYALGVDYKVVNNWYANFEFGRIHRDSITKIRTLHVGFGVKYEF